MNEPDKPLYFDTAATTAVAPEVLARMIDLLDSKHAFANPSSSIHRYGQAAAAVVASARAEIAAELGCEADEVVFTSGATEANNLALRGVALAHAAQGRHVVTSAIEHKSVLECCAALQREGYAVTYLKPNSAGWVEPDAVARALRPDTLLVSLQHTNNETGVMQPIAEVADLAVQAGVLLHVDAAQAVGKFKIDLQQIPIDLLALSAHKFHGPKGIGCLVVRNRRQLRLQPLMYGGGQEFGLRPGTLAPHQIVGLSTALSLAAKRRTADLAHVRELKRRFLQQLGECLPVQVHGELTRSSPYIINFSLAGIISDALINQLRDDLAIASGSACSSGAVEPSYVLRAMGIEGEPLYGAVRLSFSRDHTLAEVSAAVERIVAAVSRMKELEISEVK
ncbi:MAG: cysteine desulfurase family protein [Methylococcaceae bacterium]|nr:cysteine desulfurase family protein [Methylococcaceae bacterium]